tara:strand:+ start:2477 stop:3067 length:591 start_codon:yes stop_codon:yes gene_type:complete
MKGFDSFWIQCVPIKLHLCISTVLFFVSLGIGYIHASLYPEMSQEIFKSLQNMISEKITDPRPFYVAYSIFFNNVIASFIVIIGGISFGIISLFGIIFNGIILGLVISIVKSESSILLISILPHGIIELPVFLISSSIGLSLGHQVLNKLRHKAESNLLKDLKNWLIFYLKWLVPLLLIAAIIEATISMSIVNFLK